MPNIKSAKKRAQIQERNRLRNNSYKSAIRTARKKLFDALTKGASAEEITEKLNQVYSLVDRAVLKGIVHKNTGARYKARVTARVNKHNQGEAA